MSKQAASIFPDDDVSDDDALDMFGDDLDAKQSKDNDKKDEGEKTGSHFLLRMCIISKIKCKCNLAHSIRAAIMSSESKRRRYFLDVRNL